VPVPPLVERKDQNEALEMNEEPDAALADLDAELTADAESDGLFRSVSHSELPPTMESLSMAETTPVVYSHEEIASSSEA